MFRPIFSSKIGGGYAYPGKLLNSVPGISYNPYDPGDHEYGLAQSYSLLNTGQYSGSVQIEEPGYAADTISFDAASKKLSDSAGKLTFWAGDKIIIRGSLLNDGTYTIASRSASWFTVNESFVDESAGRTITIWRTAILSNNVVKDNNTSLIWMCDSTETEQDYLGTVGNVGVGDNSSGLHYWLSTSVYDYGLLHPADASLSIIKSTKTIKIIGGAAEAYKFYPNSHIVLTGVDASLTYKTYKVVSVTVNGADLDIVIDPGNNNILIDTPAGGSRAIYLASNSAWAFMSAVNAAALGGHSDWRIPSLAEFLSLFLGWPNSYPYISSLFNWTGTSADYFTATTYNNVWTDYFYYCKPTNAIYANISSWVAAKDGYLTHVVLVRNA